MDKKTFLILERSESNLKKLDNNGDIILEGIFAEFGKENRNGRIYDKDEYLKHLDYLMDDVKNQRCLGELDHPDRFEVSLANVSHQVCELRYDPNDNCVHGKIKLLPTPKGNIAKALLEAGVPLSISSRAAGTVNEDKHVQLEQIYTYDIVAKPGFAAAQLNQVNESAKPFINTLITQLNESYNNMSKNDIKKSYGIINENVAMIDMTSQYPSLKLRDEAQAIINQSEPVVATELKTNELPIGNLSLQQNGNPINDEALDNWTKEHNDYVLKLEQRINDLETKMNNSKSEIELNNIKVYLDRLKTIIQNTLDWNSEIASNVNALAEYVDNLGRVGNKHVDITQTIKDELVDKTEELNLVKEWVSSIAKNRKIKLNEAFDEDSNVKKEIINNLKKSKRFDSYSDKEIGDMVDMATTESLEMNDRDQIIDQIALGLQTMYDVKKYQDAFIMANKLFQLTHKKTKAIMPELESLNEYRTKKTEFKKENNKSDFKFTIKKGSDLGEYISKAAINNKVNRMKTKEEYVSWVKSIIKDKFKVNPTQLMKDNQIEVKEVKTSSGNVGDMTTVKNEYRIKLNGGHENTGAMGIPLFILTQPKSKQINEDWNKEEDQFIEYRPFIEILKDEKGWVDMDDSDIVELIKIYNENDPEEAKSKLEEVIFADDIKYRRRNDRDREEIEAFINDIYNDLDTMTATDESVIGPIARTVATQVASNYISNKLTEDNDYPEMKTTFDVVDGDINNIFVGDNIKIKFEDGSIYEVEAMVKFNDGKFIGVLKPFGFINKFDVDLENNKLIDLGPEISKDEVIEIKSAGYIPYLDGENGIYKLEIE